MIANFQKNKAILGQDYEFVVNLPVVSGPSNPILKVKGLNGLDASIALTQERSSLSIVSISTDRKTLTLSAAASALKPLQRNAFITTDADTYYPVVLTRIKDTTAILAEALPKDVEIGLTGQAGLAFAAYKTVLASNPYTSSARTLALTVEYTEGSGSGDTIKKTIQSSLKVVAKPFSTGLAHNQMLDNFPNLAEIMSRRQTDLNVFIDGGESDLLLIVRDALVSKNCTEDEIFNAEIFLQPQMYFAIARVYDYLGQLETADKMRQRAEALTDAALKVVSLDLDGDGIIDPEEVLVPAKGGKPTDLQGNFYGRTISEYESQFVPRRGMRF